MKVRTAVATLAGVLMMVSLARPAAAQDGAVVSAGYQFLRFVNDGGENVPAGWGASVASGKKEFVNFVGEVGGSYKDGGKLHTFQGGVHLGDAAASTRTFVELLAGLARFSGDGDSTNAFVFTPQVGVDIGSGQIGGRVMAGFPIAHRDGETQKMFRLFAGIVIKTK